MRLKLIIIILCMTSIALAAPRKQSDNKALKAAVKADKQYKKDMQALSTNVNWIASTNAANLIAEAKSWSEGQDVLTKIFDGQKLEKKAKDKRDKRDKRDKK